ncbi:MAG: hypothetical protein IKU61_07195 [Clostridia bacterium]|nr:hypothetical protein [Clostridia bacterium]
MKKLNFCDFLPDYETERGDACTAYDCGYGNTAVSVFATDPSEFFVYTDEIAKNATLYSENKIADNTFLTFVVLHNGKEYAIHLSYCPIYGNARIVWGERGFLPVCDDSVRNSGDTRTSVLQHSRNGVFNSSNGTGAPGMAYIITLANGNFILIDGGPRQREEHFTKKLVNGEWINCERNAEDDCDKLYRLLCERTPEGKKPIIEAWFITHSHSDHVDLAFDFLGKYKDAVDVRIAAYNLPDPLINPVKHENNEVLSGLRKGIQDRLADAGAVHWDIRSGQRMSFAGCEVEILHTHEDYFPKSFAWCNHTSSAFRFKFNGKTFMVAGDCESDICQMMADKYGKELKSDILQPTHHGVNGACVAFNSAVDPQICLWPIDAYRFSTDGRLLGTLRGFEFNWLLRSEEFGHREHYHSSEDAEIFTD